MPKETLQTALDFLSIAIRRAAPEDAAAIKKIHIDYLCKEKKARGLSKCIVWTMKFGSSLPFYEKLSFKRTNEEKTWKFNIPIIKLVKNL